MHEEKKGRISGADVGPVYNARGEVVGGVEEEGGVKLDPSNRMPATPEQQPAPGQSAALSTERVTSSIPKAGTREERWVYPSPQMFYNALHRKGKADGVGPEDMDVVVSIHNRMNERTWEELLRWEEGLHGEELAEGCPKLRRFHGRPYDLSPKARVLSWLGYGFPFDRHDWYIDRGDGESRRYVIDYYFDAEANEAANSPVEAVDALHVDVRPAIDSPAALLDRLRRFPERASAGWARKRFRAEGLDPSNLPKDLRAATALSRHDGGAAPPAPHDVADAKQLIRAEVDLVARISKKCASAKDALQAAESEEQAAQAHIKLTYCTATVACPDLAEAFIHVLETNQGQNPGSDTEQAAFHAMRKCVADRLTENSKTLAVVEAAARENAAADRN